MHSIVLSLILAYHFVNVFAFFGAKNIYLNSRQLRLSSDAGYSDEAVFQGTTKKNPSRFDTFKILFSGVIGVDAKDVHMKNGHLVKTFPLAVVGQFNPIHDGEKNKAADTMWVQTEVWDTLAEENKSVLKKGMYICGVGTMHCDKWLDKITGEERKLQKLRIQKFLPKDQLSSLLEIVNNDESADSEPENKNVFEERKPQSFKTMKMSDISLPEGMSGDNEDDEPENEEEIVEIKKMWTKKAPSQQQPATVKAKAVESKAPPKKSKYVSWDELNAKIDRS
mmetsp:Transcript_20141/g.27749  ORF Transcript_20141/g.27749 Transcript_20141/m.27749 type:complete len:280 (+) Transcript_20141:2-841(+)